MSEKEMQLLLTDAFLDRCAEVVEFRNWIEAEQPQEWVRELERIGEEVRLLRLHLRENRRVFAERVGVDPLDVLVVERGASHPEKLRTVLERIDDEQHSCLTKRLDRLQERFGVEIPIQPRWL